MITVIRHQRTHYGFIQAVTDSSNGRAYLQLYTVRPDGTTTMDHEESWATEDGVISAFNESVKAHRAAGKLTQVEIPVLSNLRHVIELAENRVCMWDEYASDGAVQLDEFYECDADEAELIATDGKIAVDRVREWLDGTE